MTTDQKQAADACRTCNGTAIVDVSDFGDFDICEDCGQARDEPARAHCAAQPDKADACREAVKAELDSLDFEAMTATFSVPDVRWTPGIYYIVPKAAYEAQHRPDLRALREALESCKAVANGRFWQFSFDREKVSQALAILTTSASSARPYR